MPMIKTPGLGPGVLCCWRARRLPGVCQACARRVTYLSLPRRLPFLGADEDAAAEAQRLEHSGWSDEGSPSRWPKTTLTWGLLRCRRSSDRQCAVV